MNPRRQSGPKLPLPKPRSPRALDATILEYAQKHAPPGQRAGYRHWISGLAAASVIGVAVLIAVPAQKTPLPTTEYDAKFEKPVPAANAPAAEDEDESAARWSDRAALGEPRTFHANAFASPKRSGDMTRLQHNTVAPEASAGVAGAVSHSAAAAVARDSAVPTTQAQTPVAETPVADVEWQQALQHCLALLPSAASGDRSAAERCYQTLRQRCRDCDLPQTLAAAAALHDADNAP